MPPASPTIGSSETLRSVARALADTRCGAVIVTGPTGPVGIVTDRDVVLAVGLGFDLDRVRAADALQSTLHVVKTTDEPIEVAELMLRLGLRHVGVADEQGELHLASSFEVLRALWSTKEAGLSSDGAVPTGQRA